MWLMTSCLMSLVVNRGYLAKAFIKAGMAKTFGCRWIFSPRVLDQSDRDSMIYADGAGATVVEEVEGDGGILSHKTATYTFEGDGVYFLRPLKFQWKGTKYIKMHGRKVYEFALSNVPAAIKECLEASGESIDDVKKIFIHQANLKMDDAIIKRLYRLFKTHARGGITYEYSGVWQQLWWLLSLPFLI